MAQIVANYPGPHWVWREGLPQWMPADQVPEILEALGGPMGGKTTVDRPGPAGGLEEEAESQPFLTRSRLIMFGLLGFGMVLVCGLGGLIIAGHLKEQRIEEQRVEAARLAALAVPEPTPEPTPPPPPPLPRVRSLLERPIEFGRYPLKNSRKRHGDGVASSELVEGNGTVHGADRVADVKGDTAWCESANDDGIGEWVELWFDCGPSAGGGISGLAVRAGYGKSERFWRQNNRVAEALLIVDVSGRQEWEVEVTFDDRVEQQYIPFDHTVRCERGETIRARLEIVSVYEGSSYTDTCISTMSLYPATR